MAKYNVENEYVEIDIERLLKYTPEVVYEAWTKTDILKKWFMTTQRTNKSFDADIQEEESIASLIVETVNKTS